MELNLLIKWLAAGLVPARAACPGACSAGASPTANKRMYNINRRQVLRSSTGLDACLYVGIFCMNAFNLSPCHLI